jgi:hypothetical protein
MTPDRDLTFGHGKDRALEETRYPDDSRFHGWLTLQLASTFYSPLNAPAINHKAGPLTVRLAGKGDFFLHVPSGIPRHPPNHHGIWYITLLVLDSFIAGKFGTPAALPIRVGSSERQTRS